MDMKPLEYPEKPPSSLGCFELPSKSLTFSGLIRKTKALVAKRCSVLTSLGKMQQACRKPLSDGYEPLTRRNHLGAKWDSLHLLQKTPPQKHKQNKNNKSTLAFHETLASTRSNHLGAVVGVSPSGPPPPGSADCASHCAAVRRFFQRPSRTGHGAGFFRLGVEQRCPLGGNRWVSLDE